MSENALLQVKVVPGASRTRVAGRYGDGIKVQVAAAPEKGKANQAVIETVAQWLGLKDAQVAITAGLTQPRKTLRLQGVSSGRLAEELEKL